MSRSDLERTTPFLTRVSIRNYKSIAETDVHLGAFTILVGRNGAGKSNFLDALRLIADGLQESLGLSVTKRGGFHEIIRRGAGEPWKISFGLEISFPDHSLAIYVLEIASEPFGGMSIHRERLDVISAAGLTAAHFEVKKGEIIDSSLESMPPAFSDRLYLVNAAGLTEFRPVYDFLVGMGFYNFSPDTIRKPQIPDGGGLLRGDGSNLASVVARLSTAQPQTMDRIRDYLRVIVPGTLGVENDAIPPYETLSFTQVWKAAPVEFQAARMSDGTLRVLAALVAAMQLSDAKTPVSLVGIEEPESALHPAAAGALMDALREAASRTQVLITSHSPDLLDHVDLETENLLAVAAVEGVTKIAPIDKASLKVIREQLFTPGELLRMDQLEPDRDDLVRQEREPLPSVPGKEVA